jgi:predicted nucleotidyltransferase
MTSSAKCDKETAKLLVFWTNIVADWADRMPLRNVYIFGDHARSDAAPASKLKIAIEYEANVSDDMMRSWQQENSTDFAELEKALGIETELYVDQDYDVWPPIRDAARAPVMTLRKVRVVRTPTL